MKLQRVALVGASLALVVSVAGCGGSPKSSAGTSDSSDSTAAAGGGKDAGAANPMQQKFPGTSALIRGVMGLRTLMESGKQPLTTQQAQRLYAVLSPVEAMATLPQDTAKKISGDLDGNLTPDQLEAIGALRKQRRARGGAGGYPGGGGGYPRGAGAGGGSAGGGSAQPATTAGQGGTAGGTAAGPGGGRRPQWMNPNMAPDTNVFRSGPLQKSLTEVLGKLKAAQAG